MSEQSVTWRQAALVFAGGAVGTAVRALVVSATEGTAVDPCVVPTVNVLGGFLLGVLTGVLESRAADERSRAVRLFFGTGLLGGFTTYSALAVGASGGWALLLAAATAAIGAVVAWVGLRCGRRFGVRGGAR